MGKPLLIGIAGGSGSGKTTISRKVLERLKGVSAQLFQLDHYYRDLAHMEPSERDKVNFDHPEPGRLICAKVLGGGAELLLMVRLSQSG